MYIDFANIQEIFFELISDVETAKKLDTDYFSEDFIKRTYTRAFFAMIEGVISQLKVTALKANRDSNIFQPCEIQLLKEITVSLDDNGKAKEKKAKLRFIPNIIFSINSFAKVLNLDYRIKTSCSGYQAMLKAVKIRDRITHPKSKKCTYINSDEMIILGDANIWFRDAIEQLLKLIKDKHKFVSSLRATKETNSKSSIIKNTRSSGVR